MESTHIVQAFDKDLEDIEALLLEMGGQVESLLADATKALVRSDRELGDMVRKNDGRVDILEQKINEKAVRLLALRQPMAEDLRIIVAIMKVSANLERMGDYAKNIAKRSSVLALTAPPGSATSTLKRMSDMVQSMISDVLDAFIRRDIDSADDILHRDEEIDLIHNALFRELLTYMMEDPRKITSCTHLLFIAKNIERAGDHTTAIAEQVHYLVSGKLPHEQRSKRDRTSTMIVELNNKNKKATD